MNNNPALTLIQLESALNHMQNTMVAEDGTFNLDDEFFKLFDEIMQKLQDTRAIAESIRQKQS